MDEKQQTELYKTTTAWSFHLLQGIQTRIESHQPDLKKTDEQTARLD